MKRLLDTNAYTALRAGHAHTANLARESDEILMSAIVIGELLFGFRSGGRTQRNIDELTAFLARPFVRRLNATPTTADRYGRIATELRRRGTPIPTNDIWIAAHCMESGGELITFDRHFENVAGVAVTILE